MTTSILSIQYTVYMTMYTILYIITYYNYKLVSDGYVLPILY
jgi:hypothetical protein